jgi:hypothetical protein
MGSHPPLSRERGNRGGEVKFSRCERRELLISNGIFVIGSESKDLWVSERTLMIRIN